jgi:hypothetical protein
MQPNYRRCISCRKIAPKAEFLRVVRLHPSRQIGLDTGMGRSAYLCPTQNCVQAAQKKDRLSRVLKAPVPPEIYLSLQQRINPPSPPPKPALY